MNGVSLGSVRTLEVVVAVSSFGVARSTLVLPHSSELRFLRSLLCSDRVPLTWPQYLPERSAPFRGAGPQPTDEPDRWFAGALADTPVPLAMLALWTHSMVIFGTWCSSSR